MKKYPIITIAIFLTIITHLLFDFYGYCHWSAPLANSSIQADYVMLKKYYEVSNSDGADSSGVNEIPLESIKSIVSAIDELRHKSFEKMQFLEIYHLTGFINVLLCLYGMIFYYKTPRRFILLPLGLYSGLLMMIIM